MEYGIMLQGGNAFLVELLDGGIVRKAGKQLGQESFTRGIAQFSMPPPGFSPIPRGVRFDKWAGLSGVLVVELEPSVHTVRWIKDLDQELSQEEAPYGLDAKYEERTLALPFVVLVLPFYQGVLQTRFCQVFYRNTALEGWDDKLLMTNLLNVAHGYGFTSWLCMVRYNQKPGIGWQKAVEDAIRYFLWAAFNRSSEVYERNSHYSTARELLVDRRISSVASWEKASREDPSFMTKIPWPETGHTVRSAVDLAFSKLPTQVLNLLNLIQGAELRTGGGDAH